MNRVFVAILISIIVITTSGLASYYYSEGETRLSDTRSDDPFPPEPETTAGRHVLLENDEGMHEDTNREWWYFNAYFDAPGTDLEGWSVVISFNTCKYDIREPLGDTLFALIYDDRGNVYGKTINEEPRSTLKMAENGVDIQFQDSYARGTYPEWDVHVEIDEYIIDLKLKAAVEPEWFVGRSPNLGFSSASTIGGILGYYGILDATSSGTIVMDGKTYTVAGTGYHDHCWSNFVSRVLTSGWDFFNIHFDNGWTMILNKMYPTLVTTIANEIPFLQQLSWPGICIITNGDAFYDFLMILDDNGDYNIEYTQMGEGGEDPLLQHPIEWFVTAKTSEVSLEMTITADNLYEELWRQGLLGRTGFWEGTCSIEGTFTYDGQKIPLKGHGITETTRIFFI